MTDTDDTSTQQDDPQDEQQPSEPTAQSQLPQPREEPHFRNIAASYRGTQAEWLLTRIIGWHDRITPDRERDIDAILYLLQAIGYIPEDPVSAPFISLIALVWARLPLTPDLNDLPDTLTIDQIEELLQKTAKELQWIAKPEFNELLKTLDRTFTNEVYPRLDKLDTAIDGIIKRLNEKSTAAVELDANKVAENVAEKVIATGKRQFEGIYLWMLGLVAILMFVIGLALPSTVQHIFSK